MKLPHSIAIFTFCFYSAYVLLLCSCGTPFGIGVANFLDSPANKALLQFASSAATAYLTQNLDGRNLTPEEESAIRDATKAAISGIGSGAASAAAVALRTHQSTPQAADPSTLQSSVASFGAAPAAPRIATSIALLSDTVPADKANEAIAVALDAVAKGKSSSGKNTVPFAK